MRIKFEKGFTPEVIAEYITKIIRENDMVIGSVNIYIQEYDENMKPVKQSRSDGYLVVVPSEKSKQEYLRDVSETRRARFKVVS